MVQHDYTQAIIEQINTLLIDEIGPVAMVLCEDAEDEWNSELVAHNVRRNLRSVLLYVDKVALFIDDVASKDNFIKGVYEINGLKGFKS